MAIKLMKRNAQVLNRAIGASCGMIYDIEDLLRRGPQQLEAHCALLKILKDLKRGRPLMPSINEHAVQGCPPNLYPEERCEAVTCQACWENYVNAYLNRIKEKEIKGDIK